MSKYLNDVMPDVKRGAKARRLNWPEGKYITVTGTEKVKAKVGEAEQELHLANNLVLIDPTKANKQLNRPAGKNLIGWEPTHEEKFSMDWETIAEVKS